MNSDLILSGAIGAFGAVLGAIAGGGATYYIEKIKIKNNENEQRKQVYSKLCGNTSLVLQSHASYFGLFIRSYSLETDALLTKICGVFLEASNEKKESIQERQKSDDLLFKVAESKAVMWETIGQIQILFPSITEMDDLIDRILDDEKRFEYLERDIIKTFRNLQNTLIEESKTSSVRTDPDKWIISRSDDIENLSDQMISNLRNYIAELEKPINKLLILIKDQILDN